MLAADGHDVTVLEKSERPGGLCKSRKYGEFTFDEAGGHILFSKDQDVLQWQLERCGGEAVMVQDPWGRAVDPQKLEDALKANPDAKVVAFVHAETSTGAISDAKTLAELARQHDCLTIVDTVTSLGGSELKVSEWGLDAVYSGSQKCLSCTPGLSPVTFSDKALDVVKNRKTRVQSWFLDLNLVLGYWGGEGKRAYHHTAPVNTLYALHEALVILQEEGIENSWARHRTNHNALKAGFEAMGLDFVVPEDERLRRSFLENVPAHRELLTEYEQPGPGG